MSPDREHIRGAFYRRLLADRRIVIHLGAGGVGKTTSSIVSALAAAREGRRVGLISIDPAKRLATALGIPLSGDLSRVRIPDQLGFKGTLSAAMLDQKSVFDGMVRRYAPSAQVAARILAHPVYIAASTNLSGPLEYMALAKLCELAESPDYDLVIVDTPPDTHALDFLARPNILAGFMDNKVMTWMIKPFLMAGKLGLARLLSAGEKLMGGIAKVTGVTALHSFADFLVLMQEVIEGFHKSGESTVRHLRSARSGFFLITQAGHAASRSAARIAAELATLDYKLDLLLFNRCLPDSVAQKIDSQETRDLPVSRVLLSARLAGESRVIRQLHDEVRRNAGPAPAIMRVSEQASEPGGLDNLMTLLDSFDDAAAETGSFL